MTQQENSCDNFVIKIQILQDSCESYQNQRLLDKQQFIEQSHIKMCDLKDPQTYNSVRKSVKRIQKDINLNNIIHQYQIKRILRNTKVKQSFKDQDSENGNKLQVIPSQQKIQSSGVVNCSQQQKPNHKSPAKEKNQRNEYQLKGTVAPRLPQQWVVNYNDVFRHFIIDQKWKQQGVYQVDMKTLSTQYLKVAEQKFKRLDTSMKAMYVIQAEIQNTRKNQKTNF